MVEFIVIVILAGLAVVTGVIASKKGRDGAAFFLLGLVAPVISLIVVVVAPALANTPVPESATKTCPRCAEQIQAAAKICRFCHYEFSDAEIEAQQRSAVTGRNEASDIADAMVRRSLGQK